MKFVILFAALVAICCAAPLSETLLQGPTPVYPDVVAKPLATEDSVIGTHPTVQPNVNEHIHHLTKRDHKPGHENVPKKSDASAAPVKQKTQPKQTKPKSNLAVEPPNKHASPKRSRRNSEPLQKAETLPAQITQEQLQQHHEHTFQKPQTLPAHIPNEQHHHDSETHQKRETLPDHAPQHEQTTLQKPQTLPAYIQNEQQHTSANYQKPQTLQAHLPAAQPEQTFQKPQTLPAFLPTETSLATKEKRDIPVPLVSKHKHPEESPKDNSEVAIEKHEKDVKDVKSTNEPKDHVQVEDLSEHKPLQQHHSGHHQHHKLGSENKPNIADDSQSTSTTQHPVVRPKPVPVAELFARPHET